MILGRTWTFQPASDVKFKVNWVFSSKGITFGYYKGNESYKYLVKIK